MEIKTIEDFKALEPGTTLYLPSIDDVDCYYYGGINPKSKNLVMLISGGDVSLMKCIRIEDNKDVRIPYNTDYKAAFRSAVLMAKEHAREISEWYELKVKDAF